ncbi:sucrose-6-phosphate hydrolase [Papilio machaon]|uniref:sucrose-6-phosphate hydrolase n=1 Tax=Papilio machaon TaxID=76193 RepID=UPI001E6660C1|nr:sucrose-6-phosphate hydrolase [Papilio machaon]
MTLSRNLILICLAASAVAKSLRQDDEAKAELERYIENKIPNINQRWRPHYHVAPPVGWMNDPNGFSYYNGEYHLFYQFYPYDSVWGPMHWGHVTSPDLVHWRQLPTALLPDEEQCFSGSAVQDGDTMVLMYTAHIVSDREPFYNETQYLAYSDDGVNFYKYGGNPVLPSAPNGSPDFRDPKVWRHGDHWYVILGSKTTDLRGRVLLYRSTDLKDWELLTVLAESQGDMGYMWECPDFFELDGKFILLMSPQGIAPQGDRYKNTHQNGYIIGSFNYETFEFVQEVPFQEIDFGHDFYAAQTTEVDGKRYLISWFSMWEVPHPEDVDGWAGMMTIVRELKLVNNKIIMKPVDEMVEIRQGVPIFNVLEFNEEVDFEQAVEINIEANFDEIVEMKLEGRDGGGHVVLSWDPLVGKVAVSRGAEDVRQVEWDANNETSWRIFLDSSSIELFCGIGDVVFSSRVYPLGGWRLTNLSSQDIEIEAYNLKKSFPV